MASMGQQAFDSGKYMEGDHTIMSMMDCAEQQCWPPLSQVGDTIYQSTAGFWYGHKVVLPKPPWLHDIGSIAYLFGHSWAHALKEKHWFAVLFCDPEKGYCFKCNAEVAMPVKFGEGGNVIGLQVIRDIVHQLPALPPSVGQTEAEVNPKKVEMTGKVQAKSRLSGFGANFANKWPNYESRSSDAQGFDTSRIPNFRNTGYRSAVLQYLSVPGKLRERMLALDSPKSLFAEVLEELFVEASAAGDVLNPIIKNLSMGFPSEGQPTTSAALPQTSESPRFQKREIAVQLFPTDVQRNLEKLQIVCASGYSHDIDSEMMVEETHKPLKVDSTEVQHISQSKDVVQSPLQNQEGSLALSRSCHDDIQNSGLRASRILSGGECHVLGRWMCFQAGLRDGLPRPSLDRSRKGSKAKAAWGEGIDQNTKNPSSSSTSVQAPAPLLFLLTSPKSLLYLV